MIIGCVTLSAFYTEYINDMHLKAPLELTVLNHFVWCKHKASMYRKVKMSCTILLHIFLRKLYWVVFVINSYHSCVLGESCLWREDIKKSLQSYWPTVLYHIWKWKRTKCFIVWCSLPLGSLFGHLYLQGKTLN